MSAEETGKVPSALARRLGDIRSLEQIRKGLVDFARHADQQYALQVVDDWLKELRAARSEGAK